MPGPGQVSRAVEARIGELVGLPPGPHDSPLGLTVSTPAMWDPASGGHIQNLHHDTNERPLRFATVLLYLSDAQGEGLRGGATVFPCATPSAAAVDDGGVIVRDGGVDHGAHGKEVGVPQARANGSLCSRLVEAYEQGERFLSPPNGFHRAIPCFDESAARAASGHCDDSARDANARDDNARDEARGTVGTRSGLRVQPESGAALVFFSRSSNGDRDFPTMWHGGCRVSRSIKVTLRQFKEPAPDL